MRVLLVPNVLNPAAVKVAADLAAWLVCEGLQPILAARDAIDCGLGGFAVGPAEVGEPELVVALGGDGTILKAVHLLGPVEAPILGVNLGRLGFMAGAEASNVREALAAALAGEGRIERRSTLTATVRDADSPIGVYRALNEVYVGRATATRVIDAAIEINGIPFARFRCDGVITATATGSTAYALSAGGPIVTPELACALVVPVAPHAITSRALVIGPSDRVEVRLPDPARREAYVTVDGELASGAGDIRSVSVVRGEHDVLLVKLDGREFYEVCRAEFLGG